MSVIIFIILLFVSAQPKSAIASYPAIYASIYAPTDTTTNNVPNSQHINKSHATSEFLISYIKYFITHNQQNILQENISPENISHSQKNECFNNALHEPKNMMDKLARLFRTSKWLNLETIK
jgi:PhoPQ-activated pathogenicity-related protein